MVISIKLCYTIVKKFIEICRKAENMEKMNSG